LSADSKKPRKKQKEDAATSPYAPGTPPAEIAKPCGRRFLYSLSRFPFYRKAEGVSMKNPNMCSDSDKQELDLLEGMIESKNRYRKIIQAAIAKWVRDFQNGVIEITTVEDLRTLIQIDMELQKGLRVDQQRQKNRMRGGG
jgi:hypothetical protein